jgi:hypothetical protein
MVLPLVGCFAHIQKKNTARRGAAGVRQACDQSGLQACPDLAKGFRYFVFEDPRKAAAHINSLVAANPNVELSYMIKTLDVAAILSEQQTVEIKQFIRYFVSVTKYTQQNARPKPAPFGNQQSPLVDPENLGSTDAKLFLQPPTAGCQTDIQCKDDRVCFNGVCVGPAVARRMEQRFLASTGTHSVSRQPMEPQKKGINPVPVVPPENDLVKKASAQKCTSRCNRGKPEGCYAAGILYETGRGVIANIQLAASSYKNSCAKGQMSGCVRLGNMYFHGRHAAINHEEAYHLYLAACDKENMYGCSNVALLHQHGLGTHTDIGKAIQYYKLACNLGHEISCLKIIKARLTPDKPAEPVEEPRAPIKKMKKKKAKPAKKKEKAAVAPAKKKEKEKAPVTPVTEKGLAPEPPWEAPEAKVKSNPF